MQGLRVRVDEMKEQRRCSAGLALFELGDQVACATTYWQQNPADFAALGWATSGFSRCEA